MLFNSKSVLLGLIISGCLTDDIQLTLKFIIEGFVLHCKCFYLAINDMIVPPPVLHHLILLLISCTSLTTVDLAGSYTLFQNPNAIPLFCEALKHTTINRLLLDGCGIGDYALF